MQERILLERAKAEAENEAASLKKELKNPWAKLPGGMGATHNGGRQCTNAAHDPTKAGDKNALCAFSHVHWDPSLNPTADQIAVAVAIAEAASK